MPPRRLPAPTSVLPLRPRQSTLQCRFASTTSLTTPSSSSTPTYPLWRGPTPNTTLGASITGSMEWQTSTYTFNKNTSKLLPTAASNIEKLIEAYITAQKVDNRGKDVRAIRTALAARRKSAGKLYVSRPRVKDFGSRMEMTVFVFDGEAHQKALFEKRFPNKAGREGGASKKVNPVLDPAQQKGLESLISRIYSKPVSFKMIQLAKPHLDADILAAYVAQLLTDRRNTPRRVIRDATWKAPLPNALAITAITQAKLQKRPRVFSPQDFTLGAASRTSAQGIVEELGLSAVSSVQVEAAGRLTKRLTANRSQRKMARAGANAKGPGVMLRGFRKAHVQVAFRGSKRRVGQFGIRVRLGHT
ncbi:unnamed protein product [Zymoseptoria tritici ST99CH_3D1]|nr:unnamed protein product [Zymoseptoria tritici ST99CH_3D1]